MFTVSQKNSHYFFRIVATIGKNRRSLNKLENAWQSLARLAYSRLAP